MAEKKKEYSDAIKASLKTIRQQFDKEEQPVRDRQIRIWKKLELYWAGFTKIWWSDVAHDWRIFDEFSASVNQGYDEGFYDKEVNVFRAYLESIIAALSTLVPPVSCLPDDADNALDVLTAKGGNKIAELIYRHNDAPLLWVKALRIHMTQGMVAAYNYNKKDESYGTAQVGQYEEYEQPLEVSICPLCKKELQGPELQAALELLEKEENEYDPGDDDVIIQDAINRGATLCTNCQQLVDPEITQTSYTTERLVGVTDEPKSRQCIEVEGGLYVKVSNWARFQSEIPYLGYEYETHFTNVYKKYPHLREKFEDSKITGSDGNQAYDRWGRLNPQYYGEYPLNTPTCKNWWFRPEAFEYERDEDLRDELYKLFPNGAKVVWVNDEWAEGCNENLDDHWTLTKNPLSEYIQFDPIGLMLVSIQDITTELISLTLQTIEHGIPQTFADPSTLDFDAYRNTEVLPGAIYPAKARAGKELQDGFFTVSTATLSKEVGPFGEKINELGQFVSGANPAIFGGALEPSSRTASQQSMTKNAAMQRLQTPWKMINFWWKGIFGKVIPAYIKNMIDDEKFVKKVNNSFVNVVIKTAELQGKLGAIELDSSDEIPFTRGQIRDTVMNLIGLNNPEILQALSSPENYPLLKEAIGLDNFCIPGEEDREKQNDEIAQLLKNASIQGAMGVEFPSIMPDEQLDNHAIEGETCRYWLIGPSGRLAKVENPQGYKNVLLHYKMHVMAQQQQQMAMMQQQVQPQGKVKENGGRTNPRQRTQPAANSK